MEGMEVLHEHVAGIDVHRKSLSVCVRHVGPDRRIRQEVRTFGTMTRGLGTMRMDVTRERISLRICGVVVLVTAAVAALHGCKKQDESSTVPWKSGVTVIGGNLGWDAESDRILDPRAATADLWWELRSETRSSLTPNKKAPPWDGASRFYRLAVAS
jgi:hypothetical protein